MTGCTQKIQNYNSNEQKSNSPTNTPNIVQSKEIDCATLEIPQNVETNTNLDKENGILEVSWFDRSQGKDVIFKIRYTDKDSNCSESVKHLISHVLEADKKNK